MTTPEERPKATTKIQTASPLAGKDFGEAEFTDVAFAVPVVLCVFAPAIKSRDPAWPAPQGAPDR
jgi:hypothetical protein